MVPVVVESAFQVEGLVGGDRRDSCFETTRRHDRTIGWMKGTPRPTGGETCDRVPYLTYCR